LALEWIPAEFQNRLSLSVEEAVLREPTAIVYDRRTKSIVEMIRDILRANERASLGKTSNKNSTIIIVRHMMNFIKEDDVLKFVALNPRLHSTIVAKIHEFLAMKRAATLYDILRETLQGLEANPPANYVPPAVLPIHQRILPFLPVPKVPTVPLRRSARIAALSLHKK
jgi:hypothetical protein